MTDATTKDAAAEKAPKTEEKKPAKAKKFNNPFSQEDPLQSKMVNCVMKNGKKTVAQRIMREAFEIMHNRGEQDVLKTFEKAMENVTPNLEVKPKRIGGAVYQIPMDVKPKRQLSLAIRWLLDGARSKKGKPMADGLASEIIDAANERGYAFGRREEMHRMAQANKAFAHLARY